ncbi:hypothetical protein P9057_06605 [Gallibacterium anatis]|uniref:hypothetical protein n=1 Tax=Gallibacterium anatis TaxID=750 RepID=UPI0030057788
MQKQKSGFFASLFWFCYALFLIGLFGIFSYVFWQNGLMTSWLSGIGYIALALLMTCGINALLILVYFAFTLFSRLFDAVSNFASPSKNKAV